MKHASEQCTCVCFVCVYMYYIYRYICITSYDFLYIYIYIYIYIYEHRLVRILCGREFLLAQESDSLLGEEQEGFAYKKNMFLLHDNVSLFVQGENVCF
jgi:hypothetical protein